MTGLIWVTWRQQRVLVGAGLAVIAGIALAGWIETRFTIDVLAASNTRALGAFLPAALGAFWGAPLLARPLENRTADLLWTQTVPRVRWLAVTLAGLGVLTLAVALAVRTILAVVLDGRFSVLYQHDVVSAAAVGYTLFAVALGAFTGAVLGRVEPAMAVTVLTYAVVRFVAGVARQELLGLWRPESLQWLELGVFGAGAAALVAGTFGVLARRGTSS